MKNRTPFDVFLVMAGSVCVHFQFYGLGAYLIGVGLL